MNQHQQIVVQSRLMRADGQPFSQHSQLVTTPSPRDPRTLEAHVTEHIRQAITGHQIDEGEEITYAVWSRPEEAEVYAADPVPEDAIVMTADPRPSRIERRLFREGDRITVRYTRAAANAASRVAKKSTWRHSDIINEALIRRWQRHQGLDVTGGDAGRDAGTTLVTPDVTGSDAGPASPGGRVTPRLTPESAEALTGLIAADAGSADSLNELVCDSLTLMRFNYPQAFT